MPSGRELWRRSLLGAVLTVLLLPLASVQAISRVAITEDGGYTNVVIKIRKEVSEDDCPDILRGIKGLMDASSTALHTALHGAAYFQSITIVVPASWRDSKCGVAIRPPAADTPYAAADIWIEKPGSIHGHLPATQQSAGCGKPGDYIMLPNTALLTTPGGAGVSGRNFTSAEVRHFVHQWAKYRYGIFDETGFDGDTQYPAYYKHNGLILPTVAHNGGELSGSWLRNGEPCDPTEPSSGGNTLGETNNNNSRPSSCRFEPTTLNPEVTCSLGHGLNLPAANYYCEANLTAGHQLLPTKQTVLCDGRSALEVIMAHRDFASGWKHHHRNSRQQQPEQSRNPEIRIVREPATKYVLAIDTSAAMATDDHWRWIHKAAHKFIRYDLPVDSNLAILTFNDRVKLEHQLVQVTSDEVRARLADTVPVRYHLSTKEQSCLLCALRLIYDEVLRPSDAVVAGTHIVIVSRPPNRHLQEAEEHDQVRSLLAKHNARLSIIVVPSAATAASSSSAGISQEGQADFYDEMAALSGGRSFQLADSGHAMDLLYDLNAAFARILTEDSLQPTESPELVHRAEFYSDSSANAVSHGSFVIDSSLGRDTMFGIYVKDEEDHLIKSVQFTDSRGNVYGPFTKMSSTFDLVNLKTINFVGQAPPFGDPAHLGKKWSYAIEWIPGQSSRKSIAILTSRPRSRDENQLIAVRAWTDRDAVAGVPSALIDGAVTIFVQVLKGRRPVLRARVLAEVEVEAYNGTMLTILPLHLLDNGDGDADLVGDDGLYSARLTSYPTTGRYSFRILVEGQPEVTLVPAVGLEAASSQLCCGSSTHLLEALPSRLTATGDFSRTVIGPVVHIDQLPDLRRLPPGKVTDLRVTVLDDNDNNSSGSNNNGKGTTAGRLSVSWSTPGGDYNLGAVASCRLVYGADVTDLLDPTRAPDHLAVIPRSDLQPAGVENRQLVVEFPHRGVDYYLGMVCLDTEGNLGRMSNLVAVFLHVLDLELAEDGGEVDTTGGNESVQGLGLLSSEKDWIMVGVICGILLVLIVISVVSISYFCCVSSRRRNANGGGKLSGNNSGRERKTSSASISDVHVASSGSSDHTDGTDAGSFDSDMKNLSGNNLVLHGGVGGGGYADPHELDFGGRYTRQLDMESPTTSSIKDDEDEEEGGQQHTTASFQHHTQQPQQQPHHRLRRLLQSTTSRGTPVYWSASQLLSKLEEDGTVPGVVTSSSASVSPPNSAYSIQNEVYNSFSGGSSHHRLYGGGNGGIPDEFCVTVSNLPQQRYSSDTDSSGIIQQTMVSLPSERLQRPSDGMLQHHLQRSSYRERLPPPLYPKPKNITQV